MVQEPHPMSQQTEIALLQQYRECSAHHIVCYQLVWTVPAVTVTISGLLVGAMFVYDVPSAGRFVASAFGAVFVFAMIVAVERARVFQSRRRADMRTIEQRLTAVDVEPLVWEFDDILGEIERGEFASLGGLRLYRLEWVKLLRLLMYGLTIMLVVVSVLALADMLGADVFDR